ncbi:MAG: DUF2029 domain-containing protein [Clostridia bacterium]|nr:DUF2029 domain-containing protein [Clostridia bacterium]
MLRKKSRLQKKTSVDELTTLLFVFFSAAALICAVGRAFSSRGLSIQDELFWNGVYSDHFMDLFNPMRESRDLSWVYQRNVIYPPLSVLLTFALSRLVPKKEIGIRFSHRYSLQANAITDTIWLVLVVLCVLLFAYCAERYLRRAKLSRMRYAALFFMVVSFPMIYCIERGNLSLMALALCSFFVFFRNDKNAVLRELSYISLAAAAGLKLFPAAIGVLLIYDRKWKAAARTVFYGIAALVLPYLLILLLAPKEGGIAQIVASKSSAMISVPGLLAGNGSLPLLAAKSDPDGSIMRMLDNILSRIENTREFSFDSTSFANIVYFLSSQDVISPEKAKTVSMIVFCTTEVFAAVLGFFCKKEWQRVFFAVFLILNIHVIAMHYTLIYLLLPLIVFLAQSAEEKRPKRDIPYLLLFCIQFILLPFYTNQMRLTMKAIFAFQLGLPTPYSVNKLLSCPMFLILSLAVMTDTVIGLIAGRKAKRKAKTPAEPEDASLPVAAEA